MIKALEVEEGTWHADELRGAGEAFLASTTREIQPVRSIDGTELGSAPGPVTLEAEKAFAETVASELATRS
jgi:branched-chain amino acid aminotransferase